MFWLYNFKKKLNLSFQTPANKVPLDYYVDNGLYLRLKYNDIKDLKDLPHILSQKVGYYNFNVQSSSFDDVLQRLNIDYEVKVPAVYVIEKGEVRYNITNIQDEETVNSFIENNRVVSFSNQDS